MTLLKLAIWPPVFCELFRGFGFWRISEDDAENFIVQRKLATQSGDRGRRGVENDIRVKTRAVLLIRDARERLAVHLLDGFDFAASGGDVGGDFVEGFFDALFLARRVQDEQTFVSFHFALPSFVESSTTPLN